MKRYAHVVPAVVAILAACGDGDPSANYLAREEMLKPETCMDCHPKHYEQWQSSMHAYAADDPFFLAMNARGQRETDGDLGDFCVGCHAPMAVREGLTTDGLNLDEVPQEYKGVTCYFCHTVDAVEGTHNNPLVLADDLVMRASYDKTRENGVHATGYSEFLDRNRKESADLCGSCHDIVTPAGVELERTYSEWQESVFNTGEFPQTCGECHMSSNEDVIADFDGVSSRKRHDHTWPGVDLAITDWPGIEMQRELIIPFMDTSVQSELCYNPDGNRMQLRLNNVGAGHSWPSGSAQDRRAWVELVATIGEDEILASGVVGPDDRVVDMESEDPLMWVIRDQVFDSEDTPVHMFWDVARVDDKLLPGPVTFDIEDPRYDHSVLRDYPLGANPRPDRVAVKLKIRSVGRDFLDDLIESGDLSEEFADSFAEYEVGAAAIVWTPEEAGSDGCVP